MTQITAPRIQHVAVVMPVHNEEQHLGKALTRLQTAADVLKRMHPDVRTSITVVLDSCTDRSRDVAAAQHAVDSRFSTVNVKLRSPGASRDFGIRSALGRLPAHALDRIWLANTDADSTVPPNWLLRHMELANEGADAVLGSVEPNPQDLDPTIFSRWLELHPFREDHQNIYGANLGIRASAYLTVGGFPKLRAHEDRGLIQRIRRHGFHVKATDSMRVMTSGRTQARAPEGFAAYLRALGAEHAATPS